MLIQVLKSIETPYELSEISIKSIPVELAYKFRLISDKVIAQNAYHPYSPEEAGKELGVKLHEGLVLDQGWHYKIRLVFSMPCTYGFINNLLPTKQYRTEYVTGVSYQIARLICIASESLELSENGNPLPKYRNRFNSSDYYRIKDELGKEKFVKVDTLSKLEYYIRSGLNYFDFSDSSLKTIKIPSWQTYLLRLLDFEKDNHISEGALQFYNWDYLLNRSVLDESRRYIYMVKMSKSNYKIGRCLPKLKNLKQRLGEAKRWGKDAKLVAVKFDGSNACESHLHRCLDAKKEIVDSSSLFSNLYDFWGLGAKPDKTLTNLDFILSKFSLHSFRGFENLGGRSTDSDKTASYCKTELELLGKVEEHEEHCNRLKNLIPRALKYVPTDEDGAVIMSGLSDKQRFLLALEELSRHNCPSRQMNQQLKGELWEKLNGEKLN